MKNYKLSTAIRKGQGPQCRNGDYFFRGRSCALGGAYKEKYGLPLPDDRIFHERLFGAWPELSEYIVPINVPDQIKHRGLLCVLVEIIGILNDDLKWSRDKIADFVDNLGY